MIAYQEKIPWVKYCGADCAGTDEFCYFCCPLGPIQYALCFLNPLTYFMCIKPETKVIQNMVEDILGVLGTHNVFPAVYPTENERLVRFWAPVV